MHAARNLPLCIPSEALRCAALKAVIHPIPPLPMQAITRLICRHSRTTAMLLLSLRPGISAPEALGESSFAPSHTADLLKPARNGPTHDVIAEETLRSLAQQAHQQAKAIAAKTTPVSGPPPSTQSSLLTSSILISDGETFTIVPIGSVLHLPANLRPRIIPQPRGDVLMWPDFLQKNSSWIAAKEVSLPMSRGDSKAAASVLRELSNETRLVVAVYRNCPITILEHAKAAEPRTNKPDVPR